MQPEREELLDQIGFSWETVDPRHVPFNVRIQQLTEFKEEFGHCNVPTKCEGKYKKLGIWVDRQRQQYKNRKAAEEASNMADPMKKIRITSITREEIHCLEELGFVWEVARGGTRRQISLSATNTTTHADLTTSSSQTASMSSISRVRHMHRESIDTVIASNTSPRTAEEEIEQLAEQYIKLSQNLDDILADPIQLSERSQEVIAREQQNKSRGSLLSSLRETSGGPDFGSSDNNARLRDPYKIAELQQELSPENKQMDRRNTVSNHNLIADDANAAMKFGDISHVVPKYVSEEFLSGLDNMAPDLKNSMRSTSRRSMLSSFVARSISSLSLTMSMHSLSLGSSRMSIASTAHMDNDVGDGGSVVIMDGAESSAPPSRDFMKRRVEQKKKSLARRNAH